MNAPERQILGKPTVAVSSKPVQNPEPPSLLWEPFLAIALAAFAVEIPFFFFGTPSGHDFEFHLYSWLDVLSQWRHGTLYPRWAAMAHFGYGEPRFVFYPPASWVLGALIGAVFPWGIASSVYIWLALVLAGISMFVLARRWMGRTEAGFAAVLYAVNPYHLVIVYWRSAFAELLAACLVPLLLMFLLDAAEQERPSILPLGLVLAAAWLTNAPAAVMIHYSMALLVVLLAWKKRSPRLLLTAGGAVLLGACLAAFYLVPAIFEQRWVTIQQAVSAGSRPRDNFLFIHTNDPDHDAFNHIISWVAMLEMAAIFLAAIAGKVQQRAKRDLWMILLTWEFACGLLLFPASEILWKILPKLQFMQFPWRWVLCLSMIFALAVTMGLRRWTWRAVVCVLAVILIAGSWIRIQEPWWDNAADLREMQDNMSDRIGYEGTDEYTPVGANPSGADKEARNVTVSGPARAAIHVSRWDAEHKLFSADVSAPDQLAVKLFPYPAWRVEVNGREVQPGRRSRGGQMMIPVNAGANRVEITFSRTEDRTAGGWISVVTALGVVAWEMRRRAKIKTSSPQRALGHTER